MSGVDRRPHPIAREAEQALLGGAILQPEKIPELSEIVSAADFKEVRHGALFGLLCKMHANGETIDMVTIPERIAREGRQDQYGGVAYVVELPDRVPAVANLGHYAKIIKEKAVLRELIKFSTELRDQAYAEPEDLEAVLNEASRQLVALGQGAMRRAWAPVSMILDEELLRVEKLTESDGMTTGATTGFPDLDAKLAGLHPTDLVILAARPAMGKTALALNLAQNVALMEDRPVGIFSMEMSRGQLVTRMLCCHGMVDAGKVRTGNLDTDEWNQLLEASDYLRRAQVHIDDTPGLSIGEVQTRARRLKAEVGDLALVVIDYLQLMKGEDPRASREQQISSISRGLKGLAKDLDCAVLALSQLNRGVESRQDKRPLVSDLRESGAIEQDADVIMFIYRDEYYNPDTDDKGLAEVIIAKQRNGPTGTVKLVFQGQFARFDSFAGDGPLL